MFKREQQRIDGDVAYSESQLERAGVKLEEARALIELCLDLLSNCHQAYRRAKPKARRRWNQAVFKAIYVEDRRISGLEYKEPFDTLLSKGSSKERLVG